MEEKKVTRGRKVTPKSEDTVEIETLEEKVETEEHVEKKPVRQRANKIDPNDLIPVRSLTKGRLVYVSRATNARYIWGDYGDIEYLTFGEINTMRSQYPKFINDCMLIIEDDEVVDLYKLGKLYETAYSAEELDAIFRKSNEEISEMLPSLPSGIKKAIASRAQELIESKKLTDYFKIETVQNALKVDLLILLQR